VGIRRGRRPRRAAAPREVLRLAAGAPTNPSGSDWRALRVLYTQAQIDAMRRAGVGYLGFRVGITPAGDWQYFIAGD
jgi:hypothetical protein